MRTCAGCEAEVAWDATECGACGFDLNLPAQRLAEATAAAASGRRVPPPRRATADPLKIEAGWAVRIGSVIALLGIVLAVLAVLAGLAVLSEIGDVDMEISTIDKFNVVLGAAAPALILSLLLIGAGISMRLFGMYVARRVGDDGPAFETVTHA